MEGNFIANFVENSQSVIDTVIPSIDTNINDAVSMIHNVYKTSATNVKAITNSYCKIDSSQPPW